MRLKLCLLLLGKISEIMISTLLNKYEYSGSFIFDGTVKLRKLMSSQNVPNELGVYLIYSIKNGLEELIYIGKAGSIKTDGSRSEQGLFRRLQNKQDGLDRNQYFSDYIVQNKCEIRVFWFVTHSECLHKDLPAFVESCLLQEYYSKYGCLPKLNKSV